MSAKLIWLTGLSGSGKTTIARELHKKLVKNKLNVIHLDGDAIREINGHDLGFCNKDRLANAWRIHRFALYLIKQNINVVCSTISLFHEIHKANRNKFQKYYEILVDCEKEELFRRNQKELYSKFEKNKTQNLAGFDQKVEFPLNPDLVITNNIKDYLTINVDKVIKLIND